MENNGRYAAENARPHPESPPPEAESLGRLEGLLHHVIFDLTEALKLLRAASEPRQAVPEGPPAGPDEGSWERPL